MDYNYLIDTHSHLDGEEFLDDFEEVIKRAQESQIKKIFIPNINAGTIDRIEYLCTLHPGALYPMIGLHPEDVTPENTGMLNVMEERLKSPNPYIAIGEIGLDYYWDDTYKELQKEVFKRQIEWSVDYDLPLMIHTRAAHTDMVDIIKSSNEEYSGRLSGVFHCFAGNESEAQELMKFDNFMFGIGGIVTFKKSTLPQVLKSVIPLERIVLETDSPYMAPVPNRGKRNESAFIKDIAIKIAEIYECTFERVMEQTTQNALKIFNRAQ